MIEMKHGDFIQGPFLQVWPKIATYEGFKMPTIYHVAQMGRKIDKVLKDMNEARLTLIKKYCVMDEKGNIVPRKNDKGVFIPNSYDIPEDKAEEFVKEEKAFADISFKIDREPLSVKAMMDQGLKLTAQDLIILAPILLED